MELVEVVKSSFLKVHAGRSTDDVVIDPELNSSFLSACRESRPSISEFEANWKLLNLRKSAGLGKVTTDIRRVSHVDYQHAVQIAARQMEDRYELTIDRILCDPTQRKEFDQIAQKIADETALYRLRKAALSLRKARKLRPELIRRIADWSTDILTFSATEILEDVDLIPRKPGIYLLSDKTGYLYIGEAMSLRTRVAKHLDHSDRKALAHYLWKRGINEVDVELHAFDPNSNGRRKAHRVAYESDLIDKRNPRFNIRP